MFYTATEAINLAYKTIGYLSAEIVAFNYDKSIKELITLDIKEFYRFIYKNNLNTEAEVFNAFENFNWTYKKASNDILIADNIKSLLRNYYLTKPAKNYYLDYKYVNKELNKIYNQSLNNTFIIEKTSIDWNKTIKLIESNFLMWVYNNNFKQDENLKNNLLALLKSMNEDEEINYHSKYKILIKELNSINKFMSSMDNNNLEKTTYNLIKYEKFKETIALKKLLQGQPIDIYLKYENIVSSIEFLPDDARYWNFGVTIDILIRVFFTTLIFKFIKSETTSIWGSTLEMIRSNGGWEIDTGKIPLRNMLIAITQDHKTINKMIPMDEKKLVLNLPILIYALLEEYFVILKKNNTDSKPQIKTKLELFETIFYTYFNKLAKLIIYYQQELENNLLMKPKETLSEVDMTLISKLLTFDDKNEIIKTLREINSNLHDYTDEDILQVLNFLYNIKG